MFCIINHYIVGLWFELFVEKLVWVHISRFSFSQVMRVYYDRLVDDEDRAWLYNFLRDTVKDHMSADFDTIFKKLDFNGDGKVVLRLLQSKENWHYYFFPFQHSVG